MSYASAVVAGAIACVWFGMVVALSFVEAPLKFRAPGVTVRIGLGIGRIVFRALNIVEAVFAVGLLVVVLAGRLSGPVVTVSVVLLVVLAVQLGGIRPRLSRRTDRVLNAPEGEEVPRSRAHLAYIAAEVLKVAALVTLGILAFTGVSGP